MSEKKIIRPEDIDRINEYLVGVRQHMIDSLENGNSICLSDHYMFRHAYDSHGMPIESQLTGVARLIMVNTCEREVASRILRGEMSNNTVVLKALEP